MNALILVKLEILKVYIKTHLKTIFIWPSKSLIMLPNYLIKRRMAASAYVLIIEISII